MPHGVWLIWTEAICRGRWNISPSFSSASWSAASFHQMIPHIKSIQKKLIFWPLEGRANKLSTERSDVVTSGLMLPTAAYLHFEQPTKKANRSVIVFCEGEYILKEGSIVHFIWAKLVTVVQTNNMHLWGFSSGQIETLTEQSTSDSWPWTCLFRGSSASYSGRRNHKTRLQIPLAWCHQRLSVWRAKTPQYPRFDSLHFSSILHAITCKPNTYPLPIEADLRLGLFIYLPDWRSLQCKHILIHFLIFLHYKHDRSYSVFWI